jgi:hypothetical protein
LKERIGSRYIVVHHRQVDSPWGIRAMPIAADFVEQRDVRTSPSDTGVRRG